MKKWMLLLLMVCLAGLAAAQHKLVYLLQHDTAVAARMFVIDPGSDEDGLKGQLKEMVLSNLKPQRVTYTLYDTVIQENRAAKPNIIYIHGTNHLRYLIQEIDANGKISVTTIDLDYKKFPGWQVRYDVRRYPEQIKKIAGYNCFRVEVDEYKTIDGKTDIQKLEMWVTDKIPLPAFVVLGFYDQVVPECPLEFRLYMPGATQPHTTVIAETVE